MGNESADLLINKHGTLRVYSHTTGKYYGMPGWTAAEENGRILQPQFKHIEVPTQFRMPADQDVISE